ncbi:MAG: archaeosortase/exosortase family protein [Cellvibrio sp.]|uniref:archaeosortase/exosortase family protein n=1 Tax=Cellvibrio sp. TaxID=1965322 RepID=UPI0027236390|nr:archaeosortase/exosortase family protein [Cellvibrio sp.]
MDHSNKLDRLRIATPIFVAILAVALLYLPSLSTLWGKWILWDQDLAHALPTIGVMFILLGYRNYQQTTTSTAKTPWYWLQLIAIGCGSLLWYLFESLSISLPAYFLIIALITLFISTSLSFQVLRATLPYLGLLIFTVPVWGELNSLLVDLSSLIVGEAVKLSRMTALIDGSNIFLPSGTIFIADGCSGLRYLTVALLIGYILALVNNYRTPQAIATIFLAVLLGLIANWLRIYLLVVIGYATEMQSSLMHDHETFGWFVFALILIPTVYFAPLTKRQIATITIPRPSFLPLLPLLIGPLLLYFSPDPTTAAQPLSLQQLAPYQIPATNVIGARLNPGLLGASEKLQLNMDGNQLQIDLFTHIPSSKKEEIVPYIGRMINSSQWNNEKRLRLTTPEGGSFEAEIYRRVGSQVRILVAKQYVIGRYQTANYFYAKLIQILAKAAGDSYFGLLVVQMNCTNDCNNELTNIKPALDKISQLQ